MADNTDEEHIDNPTDNQSENLPDEIIPTVDTETITPNQETEIMEVHHHAHDPVAPHHKKSWKSYFWEFLMLFLAVFCGFLAEYQLEHKIERDRGKEMIVSLIEDLKRDTLLLNRYLANRRSDKIDMDSLVVFLTSPDVKERGAGIYYCGRRLYRVTFGKYTDRTIQQLKNAGNFRLIKNIQIADSILKYYSRWDGIVSLQNLAAERVEEFVASTRRVFNPLVFETMVNDQTNNSIIKPEGKPLLLTYEQEEIFTIISIIHNLKSGNRKLQSDYIEMKKKAIELIEFLENKYDLK